MVFVLNWNFFLQPATATCNLDMRRFVHLNDFLVAATYLTTDCVADIDDETCQVARSVHASVADFQLRMAVIFNFPIALEKVKLHYRVFQTF